MEEQAIHISSVKREKRGTSRQGDFTIKFNPPLKLDPEKKTQNYAYKNDHILCLVYCYLKTCFNYLKSSSSAKLAIFLLF